MTAQHVRKADRVMRDLMSRIVTGEIAVGSLLPKESELAEQYGVNRSVIREAIKLLEVHRLVQPIRRRGTVVLDPIESMSPEVLHVMLMPGAGRLDRAAFAEYLEIRALMDVQIAMRAAERRTDADLVAIERGLHAMRAALYSPRRYNEALARLSLTLARATHNRIYEMLVHWHQRVHAELEELFLAVQMATPPLLQGIEALVQSIRKQDVEHARQLVEAFHAWATPRLISMISAEGDAIGPWGLGRVEPSTDNETEGERADG